MAVLIIAEAGVNHNGSLETAKEMAWAAKRAGADTVKYQTAVPRLVVSRYAEKADYQKAATGGAESQLEMVRRLHFDFDAHRALKAYCDGIGIEYLSSAFDLPSVDFLHSLPLRYDKIPSGEITNRPYLERIAQSGRPVLLSTGMSSMAEIKDAVTVLEENGAGPITILHCNTEYPTPYPDANLRAMAEIAEVTRLPVGYSDHTEGIVCPVAAVALGAVVIEKHFTLDKALPGPDHKASLNREELAEMVRAVRACEAALGSGRKEMSGSEAKNRVAARKSIVAARAIGKGEPFTAENIAAKRPGGGLSPMLWYEVLGHRAARSFMEDEPIEIT
jgi:N,N'-diacetyllegionaminate synthase